METILSKLLEQNEKIERDISRLGVLDDGEICSNIILKLRTFVEHIAAYHYVKKESKQNVVTQANINSGISYVNRDKKLSFISELHKFLQACASHYVVTEITSPRLMTKYLPYLFQIKLWIYKNYGVLIIKNLHELSKLNDSHLFNYYNYIKDYMTEIEYLHNPRSLDRYYVYSCHSIIVDNELIYEVTLGVASDYASKFNRFIVFAKEELPTNYSIRCDFLSEKLPLEKYNTNVRIVQDWCISIRPCEFVNIGKLLGLKETVSSQSPEYTKLMSYLTDNNTNLFDIVSMQINEYNSIKLNILSSTKEVHIFNILDSVRSIINRRYTEKNLFKYLIYNLNNKVIKHQKSSLKNNIGLYVSNGVKPFCSLPFAMSLVKHNTSIIDLIKVFGKPNEDELVYRKIRNKTVTENAIYHKLDELFGENCANVRGYITSINNKLSWCPERKIENVGELYYIKEYEESSIEIISMLSKLAKNGIKGYCDFVKNKIKEYHIIFDSLEKQDVLEHLFENTKVACIYGCAGTGKSFLARIISDVYRDSKKIYIANTNAAVNNMYKKVGGDIKHYMTINKYLYNTPESDLLFIDECSMVSNDDMLKILIKGKFKCLVLMGDIIQIESIEFGNWYKLGKAFLEKKAKNELHEMHRTSSEPLKLLWDKIRNRENVIDEILLQYDMVKNLNDNSLFDRQEDEIVLSLNYSGVFGINNLNSIMQESNHNPSCQVGIFTYKEKDPIIFTDNNQYAEVLYNNLKGEIISFSKSKEKITFKISVETVLNEMDLELYNELHLESVQNGKSIITIDVSNKFDSDSDENVSKLVPFQISYAVSIHKSQGLEFKNVKIVISEDIDNEISHNIFYTAITRSTQNLKIYWSKDTQMKILKRILEKKQLRDVAILSSKKNIKIYEHNLLS